MGNAVEAASRDLAPALGGQPQTENDPPILHQFTAEINQATEFLRVQTSRVRNHTDCMVGAEPETENKGDGCVDAVQPTIESLAQAIRDLHQGTGQLSRQMDRLEAHRLT